MISMHREHIKDLVGRKRCSGSDSDCGEQGFNLNRAYKRKAQTTENAPH